MQLVQKILLVRSLFAALKLLLKNTCRLNAIPLSSGFVAALQGKATVSPRFETMQQSSIKQEDLGSSK